MNKVCLEITNCCDCPNHYKQRVYKESAENPDAHEIGVYCSKVGDKDSYNQKHKLVVMDDNDVRTWADVPDWCPLLEQNDKEV